MELAITYEYRCIKCEHSFDVIKSVKDMDVNEFCPNCESPAERQFVPQRVFFSGTAVQHAEYNPAFGKVVQNKYHRSELAKEHGMVEVGNDFGGGDQMESHFEKVREDKRKQRWEECDV